ncbi:hypothetical protein [Sulfobacillus harzensis]|nr:hypothetical protein [Sulfobacillus harzensis]
MALPDRLAHHAHILSLAGDSHRFREAKARKSSLTGYAISF